jgi:hypothetical protein
MLSKRVIMDIIPQIIGLLAVAIFLFGYQQKSEKNIILFNVLYNDCCMSKRSKALRRATF